MTEVNHHPFTCDKWAKSITTLLYIKLCELTYFILHLIFKEAHRKNVTPHPYQLAASSLNSEVGKYLFGAVLLKLFSFCPESSNIIYFFDWGGKGGRHCSPSSHQDSLPTKCICFPFKTDVYYWPAPVGIIGRATTSKYLSQA